MSTEDLSRIASDFETQLSGAIAIGATSFTLQSVTDTDAVILSDGIYCFTIDRDSTGAKEYLIGQLTGATKTVSSISSVGRQGVLTANAQRAHRIGANVIISDHSILAAISRIFSGQGTINPAAPLEYTTAPTLSSATQIATKGYVDSVVSGGTVNTDRIILGSQTAGETVAAGNIVYFKSSDSRWWLADADLTATFQNVLLGVALGAGTAGNTISGGVQIYGKCDSFTGLTATATYYLSNTAGAVSSSAGTNSVILGQAFATTGIFFNPDSSATLAISTSAGAGDAGKLVKTTASGLIDKTFTTAPTVQTFTASGTYTAPSGLKYAIVELQGSGGAGGGTINTDLACGGGGSGGYSKKLLSAATIGASQTVTIGTSNSTTNSSFGAILTCGYGTAGSNEEIGTGGSATGGDINIPGGPGNYGSYAGASNQDAYSGGNGADSIFGKGGQAVKGTGNASAGTGYGSGGGGACTTDSTDVTGGPSAPGFCIVTEYYN